MFHLAAYFVSIGQTADTAMTAQSDGIIAVSANNNFILPQPMNLLAAYASSATLSRAKLVSPTLRQLASPFIRPINVNLLPGSNTNVMQLDENPIQLPAFEELQLLATSGLGMGNENAFAGLWLGDRPQPWPVGNITPLRWTSATAAVARTWTQITVAFTDTIPAGVYAMLLSECQSTNAVFHRWIISGQYWRPGYVSLNALGNRLPYDWTKGAMGVMGRFRSNDLPRLEVYVNGTDAAHEGYLWVQKIGSLTP